MKPYVLHRGNALAAYDDWEAPDLIISDGAYGVRGFHGDTTGADGLVEVPNALTTMRRRFGVVHRTHAYLSPATRRFIEILQAQGVA